MLAINRHKTEQFFEIILKNAKNDKKPNEESRYSDIRKSCRWLKKAGNSMMRMYHYEVSVIFALSKTAKNKGILRTFYIIDINPHIQSVKTVKSVIR